MKTMTDDNPAEDEVAGDTADARSEVTFFAPIRPTAARSLRAGDEILVPDDGSTQTTQRGAYRGFRARITDIREDESAYTLILNGELVGESGLFEKAAYPWDAFDRVVQPGEPPPNTESRLVHGDELWKWVRAEINDPHGSAEKYTLRSFRRVHDQELDRPVIELVGQSIWNPKKTITMTLLPTATMAFQGHR